MALFCAGKDSAKEKWDGPKYVRLSYPLLISPDPNFTRTSIADAAAIFGANAAETITSFSIALKSALAKCSHVFVDLPNNNSGSARHLSTKALLRYLSSPARSEADDIIGGLSGSKRRPLAPEVAPLRAVKSLAEQEIMHEVATISGRAHAKVKVEMYAVH